MNFLQVFKHTIFIYDGFGIYNSGFIQFIYAGPSIAGPTGGPFCRNPSRYRPNNPTNIQKAAPFSREPDATDLYQLPLRTPPASGPTPAVLSYPTSPITPHPPHSSLPWPSLLVRSPPLRSAAHPLAEPKAPAHLHAGFLAGGCAGTRLWIDAPPSPPPARKGCFPFPGLKRRDSARKVRSGGLLRATVCSWVDLHWAIRVTETTSSVVAPVHSSALDLEGLWVICRCKPPEVIGKRPSFPDIVTTT